MNKKGMFWNTVFVILMFLVFSFLLTAIIYFVVKPFNTYSFTLSGSMLAPIEQFANEKIQSYDNNSAVARNMLNYSNIQAESMEKFEYARRNDEKVWLLGGLIAFVIMLLFYTAYSQIRRK